MLTLHSAFSYRNTLGLRNKQVQCHILVWFLFRRGIIHEISFMAINKAEDLICTLALQYQPNQHQNEKKIVFKKISNCCRSCIIGKQY